MVLECDLIATKAPCAEKSQPPKAVTLVAIFFARRDDFAHGGTGILPVRTAKMALPRLGCGPAALKHYLSFPYCPSEPIGLFACGDVAGDFQGLQVHDRDVIVPTHGDEGA